MVRRLGVLLGCLLILSSGLAACQSSGTAPPPSARGAAVTRLPEILASGELRVGLSGNQPPLNMRNRDGEIVGLEVELMRALAGSMGLQVRLVERPFSELLGALEQGEVDLVISGMTITPERNARVAFAGPYFVSGKSVLSKSKTLTNVEDAAKLDGPDRTYAALAGSTSEQFVQEVLPQARLVATRDYDAGVQMVIDDEVDALIADFPICVASTLRHPEAGLSALVTPFTIEPLGIALPADDPLFVNLVQNYLHTLETTGLLTRLKARWFSGGEWVSQLP
ncbi:MAG: transporter substrate-binding domain-containing protein [Myxococcota bacterium]|nr:transporter substrate-binding domain-containing protein [Myxococcota bacterium]